MTAIQPTVSFLLGSTIIYFDSASIAYYKIMSGYYGFFLIQAKIVFITVYSFIEMPVFNLCFFSLADMADCTIQLYLTVLQLTKHSHFTFNM